MSLTPDIERVLSDLETLFRVHSEPIPFSHSSVTQPFEFWVRCQFNDDECAYESPRSADRDAAYVHHRAHLAEQIAALVEQAQGDHLAVFLAQLPDHLFSETEIQRVREWAGEWSG